MAVLCIEINNWEDQGQRNARTLKEFLGDDAVLAAK